jgi:uncharacterized membrane protein
MSSPSKLPVFLQRASYRQRRLRDAAKLIPFLGVILWVMPLVWPHDTPDARIGSQGLIYIFGVWVVLIVLTALLASRIRSDDPAASEGAETK